MSARSPIRGLFAAPMLAGALAGCALQDEFTGAVDAIGLGGLEQACSGPAVGDPALVDVANLQVLGYLPADAAPEAFSEAQRRAALACYARRLACDRGGLLQSVSVVERLAADVALGVSRLGDCAVEGSPDIAVWTEDRLTPEGFLTQGPAQVPDEAATPAVEVERDTVALIRPPIPFTRAPELSDPGPSDEVLARDAAGEVSTIRRADRPIWLPAGDTGFPFEELAAARAAAEAELAAAEASGAAAPIPGAGAPQGLGNDATPGDDLVGDDLLGQDLIGEDPIGGDPSGGASAFERLLGWSIGSEELGDGAPEAGGSDAPARAQDGAPDAEDALRTAGRAVGAASAGEGPEQGGLAGPFALSRLECRPPDEAVAVAFRVEDDGGGEVTAREKVAIWHNRAREGRTDGGWLCAPARRFCYGVVPESEFPGEDPALGDTFTPRPGAAAETIDGLLAKVEAFAAAVCDG